MITIKAAFTDKNTMLGLLGRVGENGTRQIEFDCSEILTEYPAAVIVCAVKRPGEESAYYADMQAEGALRRLILRDVETEKPGTLKLELSALDGEKQRRTTLYAGAIASGLTRTDEEPSDPEKDLIDYIADAETVKQEASNAAKDALAAAGRAADAASEIENMTANAVTLAPGEPATANYNAGVLTIGVPKGDPGEQGPQGPQGERGIPGKDVVVDATLSQSGQAAEAKVTGDEIGKLKDDLSENAKSDAETRRKLDYLWKLNQGISYQFETDNAEAYSKTVPSGAKMASVISIGGHTEAIAEDLVSADVESVKYNDTVVAEIPESVRNLQGYGWSAGDVHNSIERTDAGWQYLQRVGSVDLGSLSWIKYFAYDSTFYTEVPERKEDSNNIISSIYTVDKSANAPASVPDKHISGYFAGNKVWIQDSDYSNAADFKGHVSGRMLYFELKQPIISEISDLPIEEFEVEAGGTMTFENAAKLPIPNSVEYVISLAEVNQ